MSAGSGEITGLLAEWNSGSRTAEAELLTLVYSELRRLAQAQFRSEPSELTLQPSALVSEAYLRLLRESRVDWKDRSEFFAFATKVMREILVDRARRRRAAGSRQVVNSKFSIDHAAVHSEEHSWQVIAVNDAINCLAAWDRRLARIVELRFFVGLTIEETAEILELPPRIVKREWSLAKAWLQSELKGQVPG